MRPALALSTFCHKDNQTLVHKAFENNLKKTPKSLI
jgi:hypothetical protein